MSCFTILNSSHSEEWDAYLSQMYDKDVYFSSRYFQLFEDEEYQRAELFVYRRGDQIVMYPYLLRSIDHLPSIISLELSGDWFDISTPYGYGGPVSNIPPGAERRELFRYFNEAFTEYCRKKQIMTEFVRFHPMVENASDYSEGLTTELIRNTAYIDLTVGSEAELISHYCNNHKRNVRKFNSSSLTIRRSNTTNNIERFSQLYYRTLEDLQADSFYYFPRNFIDNTFHFLDGHRELFEIMDGEKTVAACIVIHEHPWMHYHLCGWDREYLNWSPTKLLIHAASLWGMENGFERFHLGGGYTGNDNLFQFKQGFATQLDPLDYYLGKRVFFPNLYDRILSLSETPLQESYFPLYRHPSLMQQTMMDHVVK